MDSIPSTNKTARRIDCVDENHVSIAPPSSSLTVSLRSNLHADECLWTRESVTVNGKVPPGLGYGSGPIPSLKYVVAVAGGSLAVRLGPEGGDQVYSTEHHKVATTQSLTGSRRFLDSVRPRVGPTSHPTT